MKRITLPAAVLFFAVFHSIFSLADDWQKIQDDFTNPPRSFASRPLWFWNKTPDRETTVSIMEQCAEKGYAGLAILPASMQFMSPEFLEQYKIAADTAKELGLKLCLYDEYWFPSGSAGGLMRQRYPEHLCQRLDMIAADTDTEAEVSLEIPEGTLMGCVLMNRETFARTNITAQAENGVLKWSRPAGDENKYKIMAFVCILDGERNLVDYLEPESMEKFVELTYAAYQKAMPEHFGTTIDSAFYDEPMLYTPGAGRAWTPRFNEYFEARHGFDPVPLYPAMFMEIGPDTASARNALFGFRATLFSEGFVKTITDWLKPYGIPLTGHLDQEEVVNPTGVTGDVIKFFKYQDIPGLDQVFAYGRGSKMYKLISSAATNYDRHLVMTETYGASGRVPVDFLYRDAMDQAVKGINMFVPHAVWYTSEHSVMEPDLSPRDPLYGPALPEYNRYISRLHKLLQKPGRHVSDIAVLYPIESLQSTYHFHGPLSAYEGGVPTPDDNYMELGEALMFNLRRDFVFLHPETLTDRARIVPRGEGYLADSVSLELTNTQNPAEFSVIIIPSMKTIGVKTLEVIRDFYNAGGKVVSVGELPKHSAEPGMDERVWEMVQEIFSKLAYEEGEKGGPGIRYFCMDPVGGISCPIHATGVEIPVDALEKALYQTAGVGDVTSWSETPFPASSATGSFCYRHRVLDGRDVYFFTNSTNETVDTTVSLRGTFTKLAWWNPHDGSVTEIQNAADSDGNTRIPIKLEAVSSVFLIAERR